jgi:uncharacterized damage-inducible protein DinB
MEQNQDEYRRDAVARMNRMSAERRAASPFPGLHSPVWLLVHLAETERHYLNVLQQAGRSQSFMTLPSDQPEPQPWPPWNELVKFVSETRRDLRQYIEKMDAASMARCFGPQSYFTGAWIILHLFEHESFHMGQLRWALKVLGA